MRDPLRTVLRWSLACLCMLLALNAVMGQILAPPTVFDIPWMQVTVGHRPGDNWQNPESTVIYSSAIPTVKQLSPKRWQITFQSQ